MYKGRRDLGDSSDDEQVVRQSKDSRAKARVVRSIASSSSTNGDEDKGIVCRIDAIKKGRRLSAFGMVPDVEKKKANGEEAGKEGGSEDRC